MPTPRDGTPRSPRSRLAGWANPRIWSARFSFSPRTNPAGSPAARSRSTAAISCNEGTMKNEAPVTRQLAQFVADSQWRDIPAAVRHEAKRTVMNFVGTALGGCGDIAIELAVRALGPFFGSAQATVIGRTERPDALSAAFLNAVSANVLEFDDTHLPSVIHPAAPVAPALFALAELRPVSGEDLLH